MATGPNGEMLLFDSTAVRFKGYEEDLEKKIEKFQKMTPQEQDEHLGKTAEEALFYSNRAKETIQKALKEAEAQKTKSPATK